MSANATGTGQGSGTQNDGAVQPTKVRAHVAAGGTALQNIGRRLVNGPTAAAKAGCSYRHWLRLALRRWDLDELDEWIANGCPPVSRMGGQG